MRRLFFAVIIIVIVVFGLWLIVIPESLIINLIENSLDSNNLHIEVEGLRKDLFYGFHTQRIVLKKSGNTLLSMDNTIGKINLLSLVLMKLTLSFNGDISDGRVVGRIDVLKGRNRVNISIDSADIDKIPVFRVIGLNGKGILSGDFSLKDGIGNLRFSIKDARFEDRSFSGINFPMDMFQSARGAMVINGDTIKVSSFSMEGKGIYARVKGNIRGGVMDLTMELMRDLSFIDKSYIFSLIENYKVSPGYYVIPIKSNISF